MVVGVRAERGVAKWTRDLDGERGRGAYGRTEGMRHTKFCLAPKIKAQLLSASVVCCVFRSLWVRLVAWLRRSLGSTQESNGTILLPVVRYVQNDSSASVVPSLQCWSTAYNLERVAPFCGRLSVFRPGYILTRYCGQYWQVIYYKVLDSQNLTSISHWVMEQEYLIK